MDQTLWTIGYGGWPVARRAAALVETLAQAGITRLVDTRHSPCASNPDPKHHYGPRPWHLQADPASGIVGLLAGEGIAYEWAVELGNPQRLDPAMTILRAQLADEAGGWPVQRGLERLAALIRRPGERIALLCACADARRCHRTVVAHAVSDRHFDRRLRIHELG